MTRMYAISGTLILLSCLACLAAFAGQGQPDPDPHPELPLPPCARQVPGPEEAAEPGAEPLPEREEVKHPEPATLAWPSPAKPTPASANGNRVQFAETLVRQGERQQEPSLRMAWQGPETTQVGRATTYTLTVRNTSTANLHQVRVSVLMPAGLRVLATEPATCARTCLTPCARWSSPGAEHLNWDLDTLFPGEEKDLNVKVVAFSPGEVIPHASVRFAGALALPIQVREPRLAVKVVGPEQARQGGPAPFTLLVSNPGDGTAEHVRVQAYLSEGLQYGVPSPLSFDVGNLPPGQSARLVLPCVVGAGGMQWCEARVQAEGGLQARDTAEVHVAVPCLDMQVTGPTLRYLGRKALYTFSVSNHGQAPARNVVLRDQVPEAFSVVAASGDGRHDKKSGTVSWALGEIEPGQVRTVKLEVQASAVGNHKQQCSVASSCGSQAEDEMVTRVRGLSALRLELVDAEDPVEVDAENVYEVRISNTGSKDETNVRLVADIPEGMMLLGAEGPTHYLQQGSQVVFEPLSRLDAGAEAIYRLRVQASRSGLFRFQIQVTSAHVTEPVIEMEATRIYADRQDVVEIEGR
jgi:uncharacterized repeat protein (TIGR01451 family)